MEGDNDKWIPCHCEGCESEGLKPSGPDCLYA